ncbi:MAG TPA: hypothetical protein VN598_18965 [Usitatibacter sp.]|nr:hypothetical protein [Usitatibacter sp.]
MTIGLPHTPSKALLATVLALVLLFVALAVSGLASYSRNGDLVEIIVAAVFTLVAVGLWKLNRFARGASVLFLWLLLLAVPFGVMGPLMQADMHAAGRSFDLTRALLLGIPVMALCVAALYILHRHKAEFRKRPG